MGLTTNPYLPIIYRNLPRLLALYNSDTTHPLCGCGDRRFWAWKLIDFPNGTFQGAAYGLALLLKAGMLPPGMDQAAILLRIEQIIAVVPLILDKNGALGEALPNEGSFCVTGLVLADCLGAVLALENDFSNTDSAELIKKLRPLAEFLKKQDETHGIISNHLATSALAMVRWAKLTNDQSAMERATLWVNRIKSNANNEGWMREYGGADPGYQTWCTSALAQINEINPEMEVQNLLDKSFSFLEAFALPDGSFANGCGARLTRMFMYSGAELQAEHSKAAARLAQFARCYAGENSHVSLDSIDEPNIVPFFNDLVLAAVSAKELSNYELPIPQIRDFPDAGLHLYSNEKHTLTINSQRGGWLSITPVNKVTKVKPEPAAKLKNGTILRPVRGRVTTKTCDVIVIESDLEPVERLMPSPFKFIILRMISLTAFRFLYFGNLVKRLFAKILLAEKGKTMGYVKRTITLSTGEVVDELIACNTKLLLSPDGFSPMHMASQGYWQVSDDTAS